MDTRPDDVTAATPTMERCVTSYPARRGYHPGAVFPPEVPGVQDTIDIHCHAHEGQQDALALAQLASQSRMKGLLYKTVGPMSGEYRPAEVVRQIKRDLDEWAEGADETPIACWAGYGITMDNTPPSIEDLNRNLDDGVVAVWMPVFNHANTYFRVGARKAWIDPTAGPDEQTDPMPWDDAVKYGYYMLDDTGKLKPIFEEVVRIAADRNVALFFGHATHDEVWALAELIDKLGFKRAVVDHPYSPFINLSIDDMMKLAAAGLTLNFTYDEISPLLGVDPKRIYDAIRAVGLDHATLSSDAGEPLFPNSVECMRLMCGYMEAFGLSADEVKTVASVNPSRIVGLLPV
jgi:hypothetical protein